MKAGMVKVSVIYPNTEGKKFDLDYFCNTHLPLVGGLLGDALKGAAVEKYFAQFPNQTDEDRHNDTLLRNIPL